MQERMIDGPWFVARTKRGCEIEAKTHLQRQFYEVYLPFFRACSREKGLPLYTLKPWFPGYLFFRLSDEEQSFRAVCYTRGVADVVSFGQEYARVDDDIIEGLRQIEKVQRASSHSEKSFACQQKVVVDAGPLRHHNAIVSTCGKERVVVLLEFFGRKVKAEVPLSKVRTCFSPVTLDAG